MRSSVVWSFNAVWCSYARYPYRRHWTGFTTNATTWLPINSNYKTLNVAPLKELPRGNYHHYRKLTKLRQHSTQINGDVNIKFLQHNIFAFIRWKWNKFWSKKKPATPTTTANEIKNFSSGFKQINHLNFVWFVVVNIDSKMVRAFVRIPFTNIQINSGLLFFSLAL